MLDAHRLKIALSNVRVFFTHSSTLLGHAREILCDRIQMMALHRSHQNHTLDAHRLKIALSNGRVFFTHSSTLPWAC
jgi:hypothetical protein